VKYFTIFLAKGWRGRFNLPIDAGEDAVSPHPGVRPAGRLKSRRQKRLTPLVWWQISLVLRPGGDFGLFGPGPILWLAEQ
jgi:hypothetical protein